MPRPFAYNPSQTAITGTTQKTNLAIGVDEQDYSSKPGSVTWWMGPDETDAYIICIPVPAGNQPTPVGNVGTVKFWKTTDFTDLGFLTLINVMGSQSFATAADAYDWLDTNGYWTNYVITGATIFASGSFTQMAEPSIPTGTRLSLLGAADYDFAIGSGITGSITCIYELADGRIAYGGGTNMSINGTIGSLLVVSTSGAVDSTFNTNLGTNTNGVVTTMCQQPDGKIVIGGTFTSVNGTSVNRVARINLDGTVDTAFCTNLGTGFNAQVLDVKIFPSDNKICVGGQFTSFNSVTMYYVAKINTDGTRDVSFSSPSTGFNGSVNNVMPQSDGKIYCAGAFSLYNNSGTNARGLIRLSATGGQDNWPSGNGFLSTPSFPSRAIDIGDSILYYGGGTVTYQGTNQTDGFAAIKKSDATFNSTFKTNMSRISGAQLTGLVLNRAATKFLLVGGYSAGIQIINLDGTQDSTFNIGTGYSNSTTVNAGCLAASGVYLPYGGVFKRTSVNGFAKVKNTGYIDSSFIKSFSSGPAVLGFRATKDSKILAFGSFTTYDSNAKIGLAKFSSNGTRDTTFTGGAVGNFQGGVSEVNAVSEYSDGRLLVFGRFSTVEGNNKCAIGRISATGVHDTNFRNNNAGNATAYSFCTGVVGSLSYNGLTGGLLLSNNKILAYGNFTNYNLRGQNTTENIYKYIMLFDANGDVDATWTWPSILNAAPTKAVQQTDGKIVLIGGFTAYGATTGLGFIIRYNLDGSRDATFNSGTGFNSQPSIIIRNSTDDSMYIGGGFTSYNGTTATRLVKLTKDGVIDSTFAGYTTGLSITPSDLQLADDGGVWASMATLNGTWNGSAQAKSGIIKLLPNGTLDSTFDISAVASGAGPSKIYVRYPTV